jgi:putative ATP-dependent endonuclease of OLD family
MHIERVTLTNFRCFGPEPTRIDLDAQLTALIGGNGAGKTAICQALMRIFGVAQEQRQVRIDDFHVPPNEDEPASERSLTVEVVLAFPELDAADEDDPESIAASEAVPEFFHQMAAIVEGELKCRFVLVATWTDDGSVDGNVEEERRVVHTFDEEYGDQWSVLRAGDRNRIQMLYLPAARDGARQVTAFLRGRLWRASRWSDSLHEHLVQAADELVEKFQSEKVVEAVEKALTARWQQLHHAGTEAIPTFEPIQRDVGELFRSAELLFDPTHVGRKNTASGLSDGQRSLLHLALTAATLDLENHLVSGKLSDHFELAASSLPSLTLLAVEEPENHLSPFFLSRVVAQLMELSGGLRTQSILASHSASALARVEPDQVRHVRLDLASATSSVHPIDLPADATEAGKYIREAVRAHPELYFARYVVLGEGDSEELVIPLLAEARGVPIDRSFVAIVPLGGRHTNHFWKLLSSLQIPYATLIDLDWGRSGGGAGRLKTACAQLQSLGHDPFEDIEGYDALEDLDQDLPWAELKKWTQHLRTWNVFFSQPLDLDMSLLTKYFNYYSVLEEGATGPNLKSDPAPAVLGEAHPKVKFWAKEDPMRYLHWYRYLFTTRSKPASHLRALTAVPTDKLAAPPPALADLIDLIETELSLP